MEKTFILQILTRIKSESPSFFKKLQILFFTLSGVVAAFIFLAPLHLNLHGFEEYINWNTVFVLFGCGTLNMLPVSNPAVLQKKVNEENISDPNKPRPKPGDEDYDPNNP